MERMCKCSVRKGGNPLLLLWRFKMNYEEAKSEIILLDELWGYIYNGDGEK